MGKSTAGLGRELGLNSQETNILLRDAGYLEGEPGDWRLTKKGREHAEQEHWDVSSPMHAGYITTRWDDSVLEELGEVSSERRQQIDDEISARRAELRRQREERREESESEDEDGEFSDSFRDRTDDEDVEIDGKTVGIIAAVIAGEYLAIKGAKWAKPRIEKWWNATAQPKIIATKERIAPKFKKDEGVTQEEAAPSTPEAGVEEARCMGEKDEGKES